MALKRLLLFLVLLIACASAWGNTTILSGSGSVVLSASGSALQANGLPVQTGSNTFDPRLTGTGVAATGAGGTIFYTNGVLPGAQVSGTVPAATASGSATVSGSAAQSGTAGYAVTSGSAATSGTAATASALSGTNGAVAATVTGSNVNFTAVPTAAGTPLLTATSAVASAWALGLKTVDASGITGGTNAAAINAYFGGFIHDAHLIVSGTLYAGQAAVPLITGDNTWLDVLPGAAIVGLTGTNNYPQFANAHPVWVNWYGWSGTSTLNTPWGTTVTNVSPVTTGTAPVYGDSNVLITGHGINSVINENSSYANFAQGTCGVPSGFLYRTGTAGSTASATFAFSADNVFSGVNNLEISNLKWMGYKWKPAVILANDHLFRSEKMLFYQTPVADGNDGGFHFKGWVDGVITDMEDDNAYEFGLGICPGDWKTGTADGNGTFPDAFRDPGVGGVVSLKTRNLQFTGVGIGTIYTYASTGTNSAEAGGLSVPGGSVNDSVLDQDLLPMKVGYVEQSSGPTINIGTASHVILSGRVDPSRIYGGILLGGSETDITVGPFSCPTFTGTASSLFANWVSIQNSAIINGLTVQNNMITGTSGHSLIGPTNGNCTVSNLIVSNNQAVGMDCYLRNPDSNATFSNVGGSGNLLATTGSGGFVFVNPAHLTGASGDFGPVTARFLTTTGSTSNGSLQWNVAPANAALTLTGTIGTVVFNVPGEDLFYVGARKDGNQLPANSIGFADSTNGKVVYLRNDGYWLMPTGWLGPASSQLYTSGGLSLGTGSDPGAGNISITGAYTGAGTGLTGTATALTSGSAATSGTAATASALSGTNGAVAATVTGSNVNFTAVPTVGGTTPLVTNPFAQAMDQGVATTHSPAWIAAHFASGAVSIGDTTGSAAYIDQSGNFYFGDVLGDNGLQFNQVGGQEYQLSGRYRGVDSFYLDTQGSCSFIGAGYFAGGAVSIGNYSGLGSVASIDLSGNLLAATISSDNGGVTTDGVGGIVANTLGIGPVFGSYYFTVDNVGNVSAPAYLGDGSRLSNLNASALTSGTVPFAQLPVGTSGTSVAIGNQGVNTLTLNTSNVIYATPVIFTNTGTNAWVGTQSMNFQPAKTFFGNGTSGTAAPTFMNAATARAALGVIVRVTGTLASGSATLGNAAISGSNCWVQDNASSLTNVGSLTVTTSGTTATIQSTNVLDTSPFSLFIAP